MTIHPLVRFFRWLLTDPSLAAHLARGAAGLSAIVSSFAAPWNAAWPALILLPLALVTLRDCPMCWLHGTVCALQAKRSPSTTQEGN
jgi:hypothetical protein